MTFTLPPTISTPSDLTRVITDIRTYAQWVNQYENAARISVAYAAPQPEIDQVATELIRSLATQRSPLSSPALDGLIVALESIKAQAPVITITLAAPANHETRQAVVAWCRAHLRSDVLIRFRFNTTLLGGMVVRIGSHIYDWSFRRAIMDHRAQFPEVLSRV